MAAEAAEAAAAQGAFWPMHDKLLDRQDALTPLDLRRYASELGLDTDRFSDDLHCHRYADHIAEDVASADASGVAGTPSFFIDGKGYEGAYDLATLTAAVRAARTRAAAARRAGPSRPARRVNVAPWTAPARCWKLHGHERRSHPPDPPAAARRRRGRTRPVHRRVQRVRRALHDLCRRIARRGRRPRHGALPAPLPRL